MDKKDKQKDRSFPVKKIEKKDIDNKIKNGGFPPIKYLNYDKTINKKEGTRFSSPEKKIVNIKELLNNNIKKNSFIINTDESDEKIVIKN